MAGFKQLVSVNFQGTVILFGRRADEDGPDIYFNVLGAGTQDDAPTLRWSGFTRLEFTREVRQALDGFGFVPKIPRPQFVVRVDDARVPQVMIDVECYAVAGAAWRARSEEAIRAAVLAEMPELAAACEAGDAALSVGLHFRSKLTNRSSVI